MSISKSFVLTSLLNVQEVNTLAQDVNNKIYVPVGPNEGS